MDKAQNLSAAFLRTADWLEAHPDQHASGQRVRLRTSTCDVTPQADADPETDVCYCAAGRLAYELGYGVEDNANYKFVEQHSGLYTQIYEVNDRDDLGYLPNTTIPRGNPAVILLLRELAQ